MKKISAKNTHIIHMYAISQSLNFSRYIHVKLGISSFYLQNGANTLNHDHRNNNIPGPYGQSRLTSTKQQGRVNRWERVWEKFLEKKVWEKWNPSFSLTLQFRNAYPSKLGSTTLVSFYCGRFVNHEYKAWSDSEDKNVVSYGELIEHESN